MEHNRIRQPLTQKIEPQEGKLPFPWNHIVLANFALHQSAVLFYMNVVLYEL